MLIDRDRWGAFQQAHLGRGVPVQIRKDPI